MGFVTSGLAFAFGLGGGLYPAVLNQKETYSPSALVS